MWVAGRGLVGAAGAQCDPHAGRMPQTHVLQPNTRLSTDATPTSSTGKDAPEGPDV